VLEKGLGNLPWWSFSKMSLVHTPYGIFGSSTSKKFPCKPVKDYISSNSVGERVGKSPVAELLEDIIGAYALWHLQKLRLGKISLQAHERLHDTGWGIFHLRWSSIFKKCFDSNVKL
jgi:hypothetical protein